MNDDTILTYDITTPVLIYITDPPSIDSIWANSVSDTTVDIRWNSSSAVSYYNVLISGDVETTFTTKDTWCIIHGVVKHKPYRISVVPVSQLCEGEVAHVTVTTGTGNNAMNCVKVARSIYSINQTLYT